MSLRWNLSVENVVSGSQKEHLSWWLLLNKSITSPSFDSVHFWAVDEIKIQLVFIYIIYDCAVFWSLILICDMILLERTTLLYIVNGKKDKQLKNPKCLPCAFNFVLMLKSSTSTVPQDET